MDIIRKELDYRIPQQVQQAPRYKYRAISSEIGVPTIQLTSTAPAQFRGGAGFVVNLAKSRLQWQFTVQSAGANTYTQWYVNAPPIAAVNLSLSNGTVLCDIQNYQAYMRTVMPFRPVKVEDLQKYATVLNSNAAATQAEGHSSLASANAYGSVDAGTLGAAIDPVSVGALGVTLSTFQDPNTTQTFVRSAANTAMLITYDIPLADLLPHTPGEVDRDLAFFADVVLRVDFQQATYCGFKNDHKDDAAGTISALTSVPTFTAAASIGCSAAPQLLLCTEDDPAIIASVKAECAQGMQLLVAVPRFDVAQHTGASSTFSRVYKLNLNFGSRLLRTYVSMWPAAADAKHYNTCNSLNTYADAQWAQFRDYANAIPLVDSLMVPYQVHKELVKPLWEKSAAVGTCQVWKAASGCIVRDWTGLADIQRVPASGLPLTAPLDYQVDLVGTSSAAATSTVMLTAICTRTLKISANTTTLDPL